MQDVLNRSIECVRKNMDTDKGASIEDICAWAVGAAIRCIRGQPEPGGSATIIEVVRETPKPDDAAKKDLMRAEARAAGMTGDFCTGCGNCSMVRNGTCLKCTVCGNTDGCS